VLPEPAFPGAPEQRLGQDSVAPLPTDVPTWSEALTGVTRDGGQITAPRHQSGGIATPYEPRRTRDRPVTALLIGMIVLLLALVGSVYYFARMRTTGATTTTAPVAPAATSGTLLTLLLDDGGTLAAGALMNVDPAGAQALLLPATVQLDPDSTQTLGQTMERWPEGPGSAVSTALGVTVDTTWQLRPAAVAALVDSVGGVVVDVDRQVAVGSVLISPARDQRLSGAQAAAYAVFRARGEAEQARLARAAQVLGAVLPALPQDRAAMRRLVDGLATSSAATGSADQLTGMLAGLRAGTSSAAGLPAQVVPVEARARGALVIIPDAAVALARQRMPSAATAGASPPAAAAARVRVLNGDGSPSLGEAAIRRLRSGGFATDAGGNAGTLGQPRTVVWVGASGAAAQATGAAVIRALGMPDGAALLQVGAEADPQAPDARGAQVVVVVGADFAQDVAADGG
jgi:hypothetical protein